MDGQCRCNGVIVLLASCGGGGGTSTPTPTPVTQTVTCPNGTSKSGTGATSSDAITTATAQCAGPQLVSVSPANASATVSVDTFTSVDVTTDSTLDASSITSANITLKGGTTTVAGTASAVGTKGFKFVPAAKLGYGQAYSFTASVKDTLGKTLAVSSTFITSLISCAVPKVSNAAGDPCIDPTPWWPPTFVPMGTRVYLDSSKATAGSVVNATYPGQSQSGLLPVACRITGDDCWKEAVRNGAIKFVQTTALNNHQPTRPIAFGFYKTVDTIFFPGKHTLFYCMKPFFADDGTLVNPSEKVESGNCNSWEAVYIMGNELGEIWEQKNPASGVSACFQMQMDQALDGWTNTTIPCA